MSRYLFTLIAACAAIGLLTACVGPVGTPSQADLVKIGETVVIMAGRMSGLGLSSSVTISTAASLPSTVVRSMFQAGFS